MLSRYLSRALCCVALGCVVPLALAATDPVSPKQLAGPPEEFAAMREADPDAAAIHSKAALLPVQLVAGRDGTYSWTGQLPVALNSARFLVFAGDDPWQVELRSPSATSRSAATIARSSGRTVLGIENAQHPADLYTLSEAENGNWQVTLRASPGSTSHRGFLLIEGDQATELASYQTHRRQWPGERIGFVTMLSGTDRSGAVALGRSAGSVSAANLRVTAPDGTVVQSSMHDDGQHADGAADDGVYGGDFVARLEGQYVAQVEVRGSDASGQPLARTTEHVVPVVSRSLDVVQAGAFASIDTAARDRYTLAIPVVARRPGQHYRAYAELWGTSAAGRSIPVAWLGGMTTPEDGSLQLGLDARWIARAAATAPFELRALRIEDPDHFVTVASAERMALSLPSVVRKQAGSDVAIDDAMRMGVKPAALEARVADAQRGVGSRLLLVHGYCSGGVWPASQFASSSTFLDVNQNRTHDAFARLIQSFGATWNSFGIVAHSQGGAAALHLYNYYWSGLDNATGARLIQSVGSPYQGTNLAGILAALGSWFGAGCGTNSNLSYSGAASWMAGIPTSSRAKVNYYTTSFRLTNWWTNDYCHAATDLVLSDPEDGTTEQAYGQLPGAINRGHVTGQCHTSGMRDPAQTADAARNATMSANASR